MQEEARISDHLKQTKGLTDRPAALGAPVSDQDKVVTLLGSLPSSYDNLVTALEARVDTLTLDFVHQALITEDQKRDEQKQAHSYSSGDPDSALISKQGPRQRREVICFGCQRPGHIRRNCPVRESRQYREKTNIGGQYGAVARTLSSDERPKDEEYAFATSSGMSLNEPWLIDSGATKYMTPCRSLFYEYI